MRKYKEKRKINFMIKVLIFFLIFLFVFFGFYFVIAFPLLTKSVKYGAEKKIYDAISFSISEVLKEPLIYDKIIDIKYDGDGNVSLIQTNMASINAISSKLDKNTQLFLDNKYNNFFMLKLGSLTGIALFSGLGPNLKFNIDSVDYVNCKFVSKFTSQGINQTLHSIYLNIDSSCCVVLPFASVKVEGFQQFLLCESVVVGKIPEVYLFSDNLDSLFNFVPI